MRRIFGNADVVLADLENQYDVSVQPCMILTVQEDLQWTRAGGLKTRKHPLRSQLLRSEYLEYPTLRQCHAYSVAASTGTGNVRSTGALANGWPSYETTAYVPSATIHTVL